MRYLFIYHNDEIYSTVRVNMKYLEVLNELSF